MTSFVAPWKRDNIPDYGPMSPIAIITASCSIGLVSTIIYEYSGYFTLIHRGLAYPAIWIPLFLWIIGGLSPEKQQQYKEFQDSKNEDQDVASLRDDLTKLLKQE